MTQSSKKLEALKKKQAQIKARIQALEAAEKNRERKRDTRRKILIGAYYLDQARANHEFDNMVKIMDQYLTRESDRVLFDLPPLQEKDHQTTE